MAKSPDLVPLETGETFFGNAPPDPTPEERAAGLAYLRERAASDPRAAALLAALEAADADPFRVQAILDGRGWHSNGADVKSPMNAVRFRTKLASDTPHLPELAALVGQDVEFIVFKADPCPAAVDDAEALRETERIVFGLAPPEPELTPEQEQRKMEQLRKLAETDPVTRAILAMHDAGEEWDIEPFLRGRMVR